MAELQAGVSSGFELGDSATLDLRWQGTGQAGPVAVDDHQFNTAMVLPVGDIACQVIASRDDEAAIVFDILGESDGTSSLRHSVARLSLTLAPDDLLNLASALAFVGSLMLRRRATTTRAV